MKKFIKILALSIVSVTYIKGESLESNLDIFEIKNKINPEILSLTESPVLENPVLENPVLENPAPENPTPAPILENRIVPKQWNSKSAATLSWNIAIGAALAITAYNWYYNWPKDLNFGYQIFSNSKLLIVTLIYSYGFGHFKNLKRI
jgi:hypothetical protein